MAQASAAEPSLVRPGLDNDEESLYEVVNGQRVEKPFMGAWRVRIANVLAWYLETFARQYQLGRVVIEVIFAFPLLQGVQQRRPDAAFVSYERWAKGRQPPDTDPWPVVPNLAIEVNRKSNLGDEIVGKIQEYFQAGVQMVWVLYPIQRLVYAYESPTRVQILSEREELDGGSVLPGFKLPVAALFEDDGESATASNAAR
jgi:Uma2 family endonuclease